MNKFQESAMLEDDSELNKSNEPSELKDSSSGIVKSIISIMPMHEANGSS